LANVVSLAGAVHSQNAAIQTFAGNDFSSVSTAITDGLVGAGIQALISNPSPVNATAFLLSNAPIGPRSRAVFGSDGYVKKFARISMRETFRDSAIAAGLGVASEVKFVWDAGTFLAAAVDCAR
jgi:hypothetical protein